MGEFLHLSSGPPLFFTHRASAHLLFTTLGSVFQIITVAMFLHYDVLGVKGLSSFQLIS